MRVENILMKVLFVITINFTSFLSAQPDYDSKKKINGVYIFEDSTDPRLFYYEPGELILSRNDNGEPNFQFLDMRYTGTRCHNDQGEKNFMSLLQFDVEMKHIMPHELKEISELLDIPPSQLVPLPISHLTTKLVIATINDKREENLEKEGSLEINDKESYSTSKTFWNRRTFVIKLNKYESQVLNERLTKGLLGISMSYTYYANFKKGRNNEVTGHTELIESLAEKVKNVEEVIENKMIRSDAVNININIEKHPQTIKQIDLNEQVPPAYANTEIKCYDFTDNLRPDLYMKIIQIEAESVDKKKTIAIETKFSRKHPDIHTKHISFPYAVYVDTPMRYRVTEININGEKKVSEWKDKLECSLTINATTPEDMQNLVVENMEIEISSELFLNDELDSVTVLFSYVFNESLRTKEVLFERAKSNLHNLKLIYDKEVPVYYTIEKEFLDKSIQLSEARLITENYLLISF